MPLYNGQDLSVNNIYQLPDYAFANLPKLKELKLGSNLLENLPPNVFKNLECLTILQLQKNRLHSINEHIFHNLPSIRHLDLNDNHIRHIPKDTFRNVTSLTTLWLSKNNLTSQVFESVQHLHNLKQLSLATNHIEKIPPFAFSNLSNLKSLSLARNRISELLNFTFANLTSLKQIFLHANQISSIEYMSFANLKDLDYLQLNENRLSEIPNAIELLPNLEKLQLKTNNIIYIPDHSFIHNPRLIELEVKGNFIRSFGRHAFSGMPMLERIVISKADQQTVFPDLTGSHRLTIIQFDRAAIEALPDDLCQKVATLQYLDVHSNKLTLMPNLTGCGELRILNLYNNKIMQLKENSFRGLSKLRDLIMGNNFIREIPNGAFTGLERLENLDLVDNRIQYIAENAFKPLNNLQELNLGDNQFAHLPTDGLLKLKKLLIYKNKYLQNFPPSKAFPEIQFLTLTYSYHCCKFIQTSEQNGVKPLEFTEEILWLNSEGTDWDHFSNMTKIWKPVVNGSILHYGVAVDILEGKFRPEMDYNMTELPPATIEHLEDYIQPDNRDIMASRPPIMCQPMPDPFLPCDDLFGWWYLRCGVWVVLQLALLGNSVVLFVSITSKSKMDVQRFLICNLATADLFMGIYLGFLAVVDAGTLGEFKKFALDWQTSTWCLVAGILGTVSSEMSVYTLTIITLERFYVITHTMQLDKRLSLRRAGYIMLIGWIFAITVAAMPLFGISNYQKFAICLPFETGDVLSLVYVCFIMVFNGTSFLVIMSCYLKMYCDIRDSKAWNSPDVRVAKRMSLLIFTDFLCWMPITILSLTAMFGKELISLEEAKFFTIFVLPLNSCANPFLYAIFTKQFKRDCTNFCRRLEESTISQGYGRYGNRQHQASWGSVRLASFLKLFSIEKRATSDKITSTKYSMNVKENVNESTSKCFCPICEECLKLQVAESDKSLEELSKQITADIVFTACKSQENDEKLQCLKDTTASCLAGNCSEEEKLLSCSQLLQQVCTRFDGSNSTMIPLETLHHGLSKINSQSEEEEALTGSINGVTGEEGNSDSSSSSSSSSDTGISQTRFQTVLRDFKCGKRCINGDHYKLNTRRGCPQSCHHTLYSPKWAPVHQRLKCNSSLSIVPEEKTETLTRSKMNEGESEEKDTTITPDIEEGKEKNKTEIRIVVVDVDKIENEEKTNSDEKTLSSSPSPSFRRQNGYMLLSSSANATSAENVQKEVNRSNKEDEIFPKRHLKQQRSSSMSTLKKHSPEEEKFHPLRPYYSNDSVHSDKQSNLVNKLSPIDISPSSNTDSHLCSNGIHN
ncbi:leucine-rich repeat-containing G-protein coupled receptor 5-like [Octopus vulgaris]|uniref:Leucine-rich repeat-containing G-protein coupled receptor 5-like n=1 Tax=Octopus vulgaris TaxID=6645 RepID=A0AA36F6I6_OCTVU|nr:leucine-rich repeat-containing G-protein coupled receptor 5-like [Octopus vulgaris]